MSSASTPVADQPARIPPLRGDIAIIGMSALFPGAPNLAVYWQNIVSKVDAISDVPPEAWDEQIFYDPQSTETHRVYCKRGGYLGPIARFNPLAHGIVPLAVEGGEPDQWLALQLAEDALLDAGYAERIDVRQRTAVIIGKGTYINRGNMSLLQHGLMVEQVIQVLRPLHPELTEQDFEAVRAELKRSLPPLNTDTASALVPNIIAGRIANRLDLMGPSYTVDGACASSLLAIEIAVRDLLTGQCDLALVGGAQVTTPIPILTLFCQLNALSHREQMRAFDAGADGTILGEGIGMVVLKRREDAERDGDRIYAVIKGVGSSSDGRAMSVMAPRLEGEILALQRAYTMAGVDPRTVELIEAHGTATPVGDVTEIRALTEVFGSRNGPFPRTAIGTVKSMIGHCMPAAGIAGLIKATLALYHKTLPPTLNVETPNPKLELERTPFYLNTETRPWIHGDRTTPRRAGVNAFGFGGINAHVVLEEHPATADVPEQSYHQRWDSEVCLLRAPSLDALLGLIERVQAFLEAHPSCPLKDLAYTLNLTGTDASHRLAVVATSIQDLQQKLARARQRLSDADRAEIKDVRGIYYSSRPLSSQGKLAFLFPGEGSQYINMLADLCIHFPEVRACYDQIDRIYLDHPRRYLPSDVIFPCPAFSKADRAAAAQRLWKMDAAIEAVLTANNALFTLLTRLGIRPDLMLGHSTGEYAALRASGVIDLDDEAAYARFLHTLNQNYELKVAQDGVPRAALLAIGASREQVEAMIEQVGNSLHVAMDNCLHQTVVAADVETIEKVADLAGSQGLIHETLLFDRAYHTPLFAPYARQFLDMFAYLPMRAPTTELYSCTTMGAYPHDPAAIRQLALVDHWVRPVEFTKTIQSLYEAGVRIFVEVGPKGNLTAFVDDILGDSAYLAVPANLSRRSGIASLNHMVGMLAVHGVAMHLEYLYERRAPRIVPIFDGSGDGRRTRRPDVTRTLATGWPVMSLSDELTNRLRRAAPAGSRDIAAQQLEAEPGDRSSDSPLPGVVAGSVAAAGTQQPGLTDMNGQFGARDSGVEQASPPAGSPIVDGPAEQQDSVAGQPSAPGALVAREAVTAYTPLSGARRPGAAQAMHAYLSTMDQFIATQDALMQSYVQSAQARRDRRNRIDGADETAVRP